MRKALPLVVVAAMLTSLASAAELKIAPASSKIEFLGTKANGRHVGGFKEFTGSINMPGADLTTATITVDISTASLFADDAKLTNHLKSPDFFDAKKFPKATFKSTAIKAAPGPNGATHQIVGDLTLHGVTKSITVPVKATTDANGVSLDGTVTIQREDFGMVYGKGQVHNDVKITVNVKATK